MTSFNPSDEEKELADKRLGICNECPFKKELLGVALCGECGCPLSKKAYSQYGCPLQKW